MLRSAAINAKIRFLFKKHKVSVTDGKIGFWKGVQMVRGKASGDAVRLASLAKQWRKQSFPGE